MMERIFCSVIIISCIFRAPALAASVAGVVEKGNRLYYDQKYEAAGKYYDQALAQQPDSVIINFDSGAAQYKIKAYQKANSLFEKSLITEDKLLEAKANYNLGNSKYMLGLAKENTELSRAVQLLEGALNNYKRTQVLTPQDEDVKINYKIVQDKLKELKEKLKQQPPENKNNQPQQNQEQQNQEQQKQEQQKQSGEAQQQSAAEQNDAEKNQGNRDQEQQGQDQPFSPSGQDDQEKQEQSASAQSSEPKEMSSAQANMLLEGYQQEENATGRLRDDRKGTEEKVQKDW